jgi:outer membrane protein TolC
MSLKAFVVAIFASLLAFTAEAQEQRSNRAFVAAPIDKTIGLAGEPQGQTALTLSELLAQALENNPEIQAAKKKVESARARAGQATYLEDPEVNFEAWGVPLNQPVNYRKANPLIFGVRQKLPFFGKLGLKGEMAGQEVRMVEEELRA